MPFSVPPHTPYQWQDAPSQGTPLDKAHLEAAEQDLVGYTQQAVNAYDTFAEAQFTSATVVDPGNLGSAYTLDLGGQTNRLTTLRGTLNANCTITITNRAAGCRATILVVQDTGGNHTLTISDGTSSTLIAVASSPSTLTTVEVDCPNASDIYVSPLGSGGLPSSVATVSRFLTPSGDTSGVTDAANLNAVIATGANIVLGPGDFYITGNTVNVTGTGFSTGVHGCNIRGSGQKATRVHVTTAGVGINITGGPGLQTGFVSDVNLADMRIMYGIAGVTPVQVFNCQTFTIERCWLESDFCALSIQGSFVGTIEDTSLYVFGSNSGALGALWVGSGKSAPHTGSTTTAGSGALNFRTCTIQSSNGPAIILEDMTDATRFQTCLLEANRSNVTAFPGMVEIDCASSELFNGAGVTFDDCYQEGNAFAGADFAIGTFGGHAGSVAIRKYTATGSSGMNYVVDVAACDHLRLQQIVGNSYTNGIVNFRTGYLVSLVNNGHSTLICEQLDNFNAGTAIYTDADAHVLSTYRGPLIRTNTWKHVLTRTARIDASVATSASTIPLGVTNPTGLSTADPNEALAYVYIDPADFGDAPLRVRSSVMVNATAPGQNIITGLVPTSGSPAGGAAAVTQTNGGFLQSVTINTPAAGSQNVVVSPAFYITTAGWYALAVNFGGAFTANSSIAVTARLEAMN